MSPAYFLVLDCNEAGEATYHSDVYQAVVVTMVITRNKIIQI